MSASHRPLSVLVKPTSSRCNLNCTYCFYLDKQAIYPWRDHPKLSLDTFERFMRQYATVSGPTFSFAWQGGEPTLMGLPFFEQVVHTQARVAIEESHGRPATVANALQTNGTLLDDDWARFFREWNFLIGVSVDGPPEWHDQFRVDALGRGTHDRVMAGIEHLRRCGVDFNVLTVVNHENVQRPRELFHWLVGQGFDNLQFIPCVEPMPGYASVAAGGLTPYSITPEEYGVFLGELFDAWADHGFRRVRIRSFDNLLQMLLGYPAESCQLAAACGYVVLEHNGDCYPCDFYVETEWKLGNIHETSLAGMLEGERFRTFSQQKRRLHRDCLDCRWRPLCHGECPRYRVTNVGRAEGALPYLCASYRQFYGQSYQRLDRIAVTAGRALGLVVPGGSLEPAHRTRTVPVPIAARPAGGVAAVGAPARTGRNDPCPCGSGKKHKRCCGS
ncbi:MAG: anaerobic sulfatase maturase [Chloroflexi bacterium]|nr:anaerobic sulfatase maturase [Chloroflexota bacterium]